MSTKRDTGISHVQILIYIVSEFTCSFFVDHWQMTILYVTETSY